MAPFTDRERGYLEGQRLARLATSDATGTPHVAPVGFRLADDGGAIEIRGIAELHDSGGAERFGPEIRGPAWIRVVPKRVTSWGIEGHAFSPAGRRHSRTVGS